jgi:ATP-dependent helicase HepA
VYVRSGNRWAVGRIDGAASDDGPPHVVAFPNGEGQLLTADQFEVRWTRPIEDPFEVLAELGGDSPAVYEPRLEIVSGWYRQRAASVGAEGLLLGSVELHDHQITVVRTVTEDATRRYLLADEVGLGKTIEAGALIWQCFHERPNARVVVISPDYLRQQWVGELTERYRITEVADGWLRIRSHQNPSSWPSEPVDLLVVDEAHHLTRAGDADPESVDLLATMAHRAEEVLLLSATPVRSNEAGFLDLLHLLDPVNYRRDDLAGFTERVAKRDRLALTFQALLPDLDAFDLSLFGEELEDLFPDDDLLRDLVTRGVDADDRHRPERVRQVQEHLSETYRLHHRLLRTRRNDQVHASFGVRGRTRGRPFTFEVDDETDAARVHLLDDVRAHLAALVDTGELSADDAANSLMDLASRCGSLPHALLEMVDGAAAGPVVDWLSSQGQTWSAPFAAAASGLADDVASVLIDHMLARAAGKAVVVSAFTSSVSAVADAVGTARGEHRIERHLHTQSRARNVAAVDRWVNDASCVLLFCDSSAEEGINLQAADRLVHLDLPWDAFRLEQRIGRVDRFTGTAQRPVESHVLMYGEQRYAQEWFVFAADACEVFHHSISSLQHVLADTVRDLASDIVVGGPAVIDAQLDEHKARLATERRTISAHDALDAVASTHGRANLSLHDADADRAFGAALTTWFEGVGVRVRAPHPGVIQFPPLGHTQVPFDIRVPLARWGGRPLAVSRQAAVEHLVPICRAGHELVDAVAAHLENGDRGVAYAFFRPGPGVWPPVPIFRIDALVHPVVDPDLMAAAEEVEFADWLGPRIEATMPPVVEQIHLLADGTEVTDAEGRRPYDKAAGDRNLSSRPRLFAQVAGHLHWPTTCARAAANALELVTRRASVTAAPNDAAAALVVELNRRARQAHARRAAGLEADDPSSWERLAEAVPERLAYRVQVLGCGVTFHGDLRASEAPS